MKSIDKNKLARYNPYMKMFVHILRAGQFLERKVSHVLKQFDITHIQFNVLRSLEAVYPEYLSAGDIKNELIFPAPDVTRLLDRLVKRDLVDRRVCPKNRRKIDVSITDRGIELIAAVLPAFEKQFDGYFRNIINAQERDVLINTLKRIQ